MWAELGVGTAEDPFGFEANGDPEGMDAEEAGHLEETQQDLVRKMKKQKIFDAYIEPTLKRRLKGGGGGLARGGGAGAALDSRSKMSAALRDTSRMAIASATEKMVLEDSEGEEDPEERDTYFEVDARD